MTRFLLGRCLGLVLTLLAASAGPLRHWAQDNQRWARQLLDAYPALRPRYARLVAAHLRQRPSLDDCPAADAELEIALRRALAEPGSGGSSPDAMPSASTRTSTTHGTKATV